MSKRATRLFLPIAFVVCTAMHRGELFAQNLSLLYTDFNVVEFAEIIEDVGAVSTVNALTVDSDQMLVITDVIVSHPNPPYTGTFPATIDVRILRGTKPATGLISISGGETFEHSFATGILFKPKEKVVLSNLGQASASFTLRGYLVQVP